MPINCKIKICGLTNFEDALLAESYGAEYLGFILTQKSPRFVDTKTLCDITKKLKSKTKKVGVFQNQTYEEILTIATLAKLDIIQLHGDENQSLIDALAKKFIVWKAVSLTCESDLKKLENYQNIEFFVIDNPAGGSGEVCNWDYAKIASCNYPIFLAGGISNENISEAIKMVKPQGIDLSSKLEKQIRKKSEEKIKNLFMELKKMNSHYGIYGGQYIAETLMPTLIELEKAYLDAMADPTFHAEMEDLLSNYVGRANPLYHAKRLSQYANGAQIYLKREDLNHTGAHKVNNTIGQALLAKRLGKTRLIAETGAGMHGVATATVAALFGMECDVFMGATDIARQRPNVERMETLGARVISVSSGSATLKDAMNEAIRNWVATSENTFYVIGTVAGPHPYPAMVKEFQSVIGRESRAQILAKTNQLPVEVIACVGGGSNAMGIFAPFIDDKEVKLVGAEAGGLGIHSTKHAASISGGRVGVLHGCKTYLMQDDDGQILETHSISAGLDYPGVGPEHSYLADIKRVQYLPINDDEALEAFFLLSKLEGIIPALESSHAIAQALKNAKNYSACDSIIVCLSGRGDKDMENIKNYKLNHK